MSFMKCLLSFVFLFFIISTSFISQAGVETSPLPTLSVLPNAMTGSQIVLQNFSFGSLSSVPSYVAALTNDVTARTRVTSFSGSNRLDLGTTGTSSSNRTWQIYGFYPMPETNLTFSVYSNEPYASPSLDIWFGSAGSLSDIRESSIHISIGYNTDAVYHFGGGSNLYPKSSLQWYRYTIHIYPNYTYTTSRNGVALESFTSFVYKAPAYSYAPIYSGWNLYLQYAKTVGAGDSYLDYISQTIAQRVITPISPRHMAFQFDDGNVTVYTLAYPMLSQYGWSGTAFVPGSQISNYSGTPGHLSWSNLRNMTRSGWDTGDHSFYHVTLTALPLAQAEQNISMGRAAIINNMTYIPSLWAAPGYADNWTLDSYAYSLGMTSRDVALPSYSETSYVITGGTYDTRNPALGPLSVKSPAALVFHVISNTSCSTCTSWSDFSSILSEAFSRGYRVVPYGTYLNEVAVSATSPTTGFSSSATSFTFQYMPSSISSLGLLDMYNIHPIIARFGETNATTQFGFGKNVTLLEANAGTYYLAMSVGGETPTNGSAVSVTYYQPGAISGDVIRFTTKGFSGATRYFNMTGLLASTTYNVSVDGVQVLSEESDANGKLSIPWSAWAYHEFVVSVGPSVASVITMTWVNIMLFILFLFVIIALALVGFGYHPAFLFMDGIVVIAFTFWAYTQTTNLIISGALAFLGIGFLALGMMIHPRR